MKKVELDAAAGAFKVHPRTVLRALAGEVNTYWAEGHNPKLDVAEVALAFDIEIPVLEKVLSGKNALLTPAEAREHIAFLEGRDSIPVNTFRYRKYPAAIQRPGLVRYLRHVISEYHSTRFEVA